MTADECDEIYSMTADECDEVYSITNNYNGKESVVSFRGGDIDAITETLSKGGKFNISYQGCRKINNLRWTNKNR